MFRYVVIWFIACCVFLAAKPAKVKPVIQWLSWEQAMEASAVMKKKLLVDVYTEWCTWCKEMDSTTFADPEVIDHINENFYAIKLDAEQKDTIQWKGHDFKWVPRGRNGIHTLAYALCDGQMTYPSIVFLTDNQERIRVSKGFKDARSFMTELLFITEGKYLNLEEKP